MPLTSFFQRLRQKATSGASESSPLSSADIEIARVRARRRLVGMVVLVGCGVIGLPLLFETQPRPLSSEVQLVSAAPTHTPVVTAPSGPAPAIVSVGVPTPAASQAAPKPVQVQAVVDEAPAAVASEPVVAAVVQPAPVSAPTPASKVNTVPRAVADASDRFVVQIGAYADVPAAHEVRMKAERLGVKTYTQVVTTNGAKRIRVRVGPFASKADADKAIQTLRKAGLTGALLTL